MSYTPRIETSQKIDYDDQPVASTAKSRDRRIQQQRKRLLIAGLALAAAALLVTGSDPKRVAIAAICVFAIMISGMAVLGSIARPIPEPPPPGELRKVKLKYRCELCGAEIRMTLANDEVPNPPAHCTEPMTLTTSQDEL